MEKRTHLNLKVRPQLKGALERQAEREKRSLANISEVLLEWAYEQLQIAGNTLVLVQREVSNDSSAQSLIQQSLETDRKVIEAHARTKPAGRKKAG